MSSRLPDSLIDKPSFLADNFGGYQHFIDPTIQPFNTLTFPSINCSVPNKDKIIPDKGKLLLGQAFTENIGINGNAEKFKNAGGLEMEVRTFPSANVNLKDVVEIYYTNDRLMFSTLVGTFALGATVVGGTSNATGIITDILGTVLTLSNITGDFVVGETITQNIPSVATATVVSAPVSEWHQITENVNPLARGLHEVYFDQWFDTNTTPSLSLNLPRLVWVNGLASVFSWTGGVALITGVTATNLIIDPSTTWASLGFATTAAGTAFVIVNGVSYQLTTPADLNTNSINVTSTAGVNSGDIATARIEVDAAPIPFDMCRMNKNYMFYGNWDSRDLYMSNAFNRQSTYSITVFSGGLLNDLVIDPGTLLYTGATESVFHIVIDSVEPDVTEETHTGTGLNDGVYDYSGYTGNPGVTNQYSVMMVGDASLHTTGVSAFSLGDPIRGQTSGAEGIIVAKFSFGGFNNLGVKMTTDANFESGETIEDLNDLTLTETLITPDGSFSQDWFQYSKNGVRINTNTGAGSQPTSFLINTPITLSDGLTITFANFFGHTVDDSFNLMINRGGVDTFQWQKDGGAFTSGVAITGGFQTLSDGVQIKFLNLNGHTLGDYWDITAIPAITRAWDNFYYALPIRRPGEGYKFRLPSNFWTMDTQEESLYVNSSYGEWSVISTVLSGDLLSEDVSLTPLKQAGANKVLYPYLTGHINNDLVYVSVTKNLDFVGRQKFLEKPQIGYLSDPVKLDFEASTFIGGRIKYLNKNLYISSPENGTMHNYDTYKEYWQPPKSFPETAILSIFGNDLVSHSNVRNQSFLMFNNVSDNDQSYDVIMRTPYTSVGDRWNKKFSNMSFTEGYIQGSPFLTHKVYLGVNGCGGIYPHVIAPIVCTAPDNAPLGEGALGNHALGSDVGIQGNYFQEIYKSYSPVLEYYQLALEIYCAAKNHSYAILAFGMNGMYSLKGNNELVNPGNLVINNT